jgi:tetratricopeptide (TPR) repeat protein
LKQFEESALAFLESVEIRPNYAIAHAYLALSQFHLNRKNEAILSVDTAIRLEPENNHFRRIREKLAAPKEA